MGRGGWGGVGRGGAWRVKGKPKEKQKGNSAGVGGFSWNPTRDQRASRRDPGKKISGACPTQVARKGKNQKDNGKANQHASQQERRHSMLMAHKSRDPKDSCFVFSRISASHQSEGNQMHMHMTRCAELLVLHVPRWSSALPCLAMPCHAMPCLARSAPMFCHNANLQVSSGRPNSTELNHLILVTVPCLHLPGA